MLIARLLGASPTVVLSLAPKSVTTPIAMGIAEQIGGNPSLIDTIGVNFYPHNQWYHHGMTVPMGHHQYRPLSAMLLEVAERYGKPIVISETGAEGSARAMRAELSGVSSVQRELSAGLEAAHRPLLSCPSW